MSRPDFESTDFLPRVARFQFDKFEFDPTKAAECSSLCVRDGEIPNTNSQIRVDSNQLIINLFSNANNKGCFIDDVLSFLIRWIGSLPHTDDRARAAGALKVALLLLDQSAVNKHGYKESPQEAANPPDAERIAPSPDDWEFIFKSATTPLVSEGLEISAHDT